jgi:hypothetical protein
MKNHKIKKNIPENENVDISLVLQGFSIGNVDISLVLEGFRYGKALKMRHTHTHAYKREFGTKAGPAAEARPVQVQTKGFGPWNDSNPIIPH